MTKFRNTSELPDDEGRVFVTHVPHAPFQVMGRRADSGELFVRGQFTKQEPPEETRKVLPGIEIITGPEAEELIAAVRAGNVNQVMPEFVFSRRRDIELETGFILAGDLFVDIPDGAEIESRYRYQQICESIVQPLIEMAKRMPDNAMMLIGWPLGNRPENADEITDNNELMSAWAKRSLAMGIWIDPRDDGFVRINSDMAIEFGSPAITEVRANKNGPEKTPSRPRRRSCR
jgi:hypothetical protein